MKSYEGKKITTNFTKKMEQIKTSNTNFKLEPMTLDQNNNFTNVFNHCDCICMHTTIQPKKQI